MDASAIPEPCLAPDFLLAHVEGDSIRLSICAAEGDRATILIDAETAESLSSIIFTEAARAKKRRAEREGAPDGHCSRDGIPVHVEPPNEPLRGVLVSTMALSPALSEADRPVLPEAWRHPWRE